MTARPDKTGCAVFLPDDIRDPRVLDTVYAYNKEDAPDRELKLQPFQGSAGHAWAMRRQTVALLGEVSAFDLEQTWKLTPEQIRLTQHLKVIVSTPIWAWEDPDQLIGVVSVDSELEDSECRLSSPRSLSAALELAEMIARILSLADLV